MGFVRNGGGKQAAKKSGKYERRTFLDWRV